MAIYRAEFRWHLPAQLDTLARYVEVLSRSAGYPCDVKSVREEADRVSAILSFPRVAEKNFIELSQDGGLLEFPLVAFFWAHATRSVQELGGTFAKPVLADRPDWTARRWEELKWTERSRIRVGLGASTM